MRVEASRVLQGPFPRAGPIRNLKRFQKWGGADQARSGARARSIKGSAWTRSRDGLEDCLELYQGIR